MPHLHLSLSPAPGREPDRARLAQALNELTAEHLAKDPQLTAVRLSRVPADDWFVARRSLAEQGLASYHLELQVTAGTNSEEQIAAWLQAVHGLMGEQLGPLHPASYAVVQQLPATAWGYGGRSQRARRLQFETEMAAAV
nr:4-oxalocrotonate tautomerase [uncultured Roseateles sp.]